MSREPRPVTDENCDGNPVASDRAEDLDYFGDEKQPFLTIRIPS